MKLNLIINYNFHNMLYSSELEDFSEFEGILSWYVRHIMDFL